MAELRDHLNKYLQIPGVRAVVLTGRDGLRIEAASQGEQRTYDALSALGAGALSATESMGQELSAGMTIGTILEFEAALVVIEPLGDFAALVTLAADAASLPRIRQTSHALRAEIIRALDAA